MTKMLKTRSDVVIQNRMYDGREDDFKCQYLRKEKGREKSNLDIVQDLSLSKHC